MLQILAYFGAETGQRETRARRWIERGAAAWRDDNNMVVIWSGMEVVYSLQFIAHKGPLLITSATFKPQMLS